MKKTFKAVPVTEDVWWVGAIDWNIRDFHGYRTRRGSTYNAYLILADKITLIDTVKAPFREEMMARIASVIDPGKIEYIVSNHSEMDHSGSLPEVAAAVNPQKVFASAVGAKTLKELFPFDRGITAVHDGETLSLGNRTLTFLETRMLHWPDSMFSYLNEEQLLFSQDAFGMHYASLDRFADECDPAILAYEAATYYANIILPYSPLVLKLIGKVTAAGLSFRIIAPDHGPIWRQETGGIIGSYAKWAAQKPEAKAVVVYATMWHSTEKMARAVSEGLAEGGLRVKFMSMDEVHRSDVVYELLGAGALAVGSSTLNNHLLPNMADILTYLKGLKPGNLIGAAFGSYGWSGEAVREIEEILAEMKVEKAQEGIRVRNMPDAEVLARCYELGKTMAEKVRNRL
ncbi:MAG: flavodoxin domain-containing protein [Deltaproteobacteria bacterium]|nr:flavodoxin domain-containing protein [Deltaproteobacteria bacterium]